MQDIIKRILFDVKKENYQEFDNRRFEVLAVPNKDDLIVYLVEYIKELKMDLKAVRSFTDYLLSVEFEEIKKDIK